MATTPFNPPGTVLWPRVLSPSHDRAVGFERQTVTVSCGDFCEACSRGDIRNYLASPTDNISRRVISVLRLGLWNECYRYCRQSKKCFQFHIHAWLSWHQSPIHLLWGSGKFESIVSEWVGQRRAFKLSDCKKNGVHTMG